MPPVEELLLWHLSIPLRRPYVLSFGVLRRLDSFVALARFADGSVGFGESCPLPGYSHETAALLLTEFSLLERDGDVERFLRRNRNNPFVTAPVLSCLEGPARVGATVLVEVCPILQWDRVDEVQDRVQDLAATGHRLAKVKITADLNEGRFLVNKLQQVGEQVGMRFRYDANQALDPELAAQVVGWLDHPTTELLEQPLPVEAWEEMTRLRQRSKVPLMLDEAILDGASVERAVGRADLVKLKLAKNGSPERLKKLTSKARQLGLDVVLGNGVQGTLGCWLEAQVQHEMGLSRAGEMNGFRKLHGDPLEFLLRDLGSKIELPATISVSQVEPALRRHAEPTFRIRPIGEVYPTV